MRFIRLCTLCLLASLTISRLYAQGCGNLNLALKSDIGSTCQFMVMTMAHDVTDRPYLYVANKEAGMVVYDISDPTAPVKSSAIPTSKLGGLDVMNLYQQGSYVYLAIGNHFNKDQAAGLAVIDVSDPLSPAVTDYWVMPSSSGGSGIVRVEGNYAYLGAMGNGLAILDVTDKYDIRFISKIVPDINYPTPNPNPDLYNARGMEVKNSIVYLCYDAGGVRIINATDKANPKETGRYSNPALNGHPRAYNNLVLDGNYLYVAVDYCGLEVLDISDTSDIKLTGTWNPYNCPANNWFSSPVHANEIAYQKDCKLLFLATGKSDMHVINIADPAHPDSCNFYGGTGNNLGTWGVNFYKDQVYLSYICAVVPFGSNWTGIKILTYTPCASSIKEARQKAAHISPIPSVGDILVDLNAPVNQTEIEIRVIDFLGRAYYPAYRSEATNRLRINTGDLPAGMYILQIKTGDKITTGKFVMQ